MPVRFLQAYFDKPYFAFFNRFSSSELRVKY